MADTPAPHAIFDAALLRRRLARAQKAGRENFLLERAVEDLVDRLATVTRAFTNVLDVASPSPIAATVLTRLFPQAAVKRLAPMREPDAHAVIGADERLPVEAQSFDLAVSLLALQAVNDLPGVLAQIRRALKPDGLFIAALLGGQSLQELRDAFTQAELETRGGASPRVAPFADVRDMGALLQRAGFALPVSDVDVLTVRYPDMFGLVRDLRAMGATNALVARERKPLARQTALRAAQIYAERFSDADGRVRATFEIIWLSGWAPHESQQKPLRPGSARMRLADALHTKTYGDKSK
jgi:SAM-dependent methyltransferase